MKSICTIVFVLIMVLAIVVVVVNGMGVVDIINYNSISTNSIIEMMDNKGDK